MKTSSIYFETLREYKIAWVRQARFENMKLVDWIVKTLNNACKENC